MKTIADHHSKAPVLISLRTGMTILSCVIFGLGLSIAIIFGGI